MLALIGVLGIGLFIYLLARGRHSMIVAFIVPILLIPIACGLYTGNFSLKDMSACITGGIQNTASLGIMAAFAVLYFTMMNDLGVFDVIVNFITRHIGNHIYPVLVATFFVSIASHLDGQAPSTILVTIPAMYPFFKKLKIRPQILAYILSLAVGIWNFLPWGAVNLTNSVVMGAGCAGHLESSLPVDVHHVRVRSRFALLHRQARGEAHRRRAERRCGI